MNTVDNEKTEARLALVSIRKQFPGCLANDDVSLTIEAGEIHALLGENGAGKSTLVKIMYGVLAADSGQIFWEGEAINIGSPSVARQLGIGMVFQHFTLFEAMTVTENIALGLDSERDLVQLEERIRKVSQKYGLPLSPDRHVHSLSVGERQRIEIVRCLLQNPKLLIMDEPTSVLTPQESSKLFETLRRLSAEGVSILFISHKLDEIKALCHRATIMRAGRVTAEVDPRQETAASMAALMIGDELVKPEQRASTDFGEIRLRVNDLSLRADSQFGINLRNVSLQVRGGEVFGIAGVAGNGQIELLSVLSGETLSDSAAIEIMGKAVGKLGPAHRRAQGMTFVPEERLGHGSVPDMSLIENTVLSAHKRMNFLAAGLIDYQAAGEFASEVRQRFKVKSHGVEASAGSLSGGNLQKFIIGREIMQEPDLLIVAHPTWGVDAGAAAAIHQALLDLAQSGVAVLVISQDLDELFAISDRIAVISDGRLSAPQATSTVTIEEIGLLMGGLHDKPGDHDNDNDKGVNNAA